MTVSVLICTFGDPDWSELAWSRAYPSALAQTIPPADVLVRHSSGGTLAEVRNSAAESATTDWLCFLDADDELEPEYLQRMAVYIAAPGHGERLLAPAIRYVRDGVPGPAGLPPFRGWPSQNVCCIGTLIRRAFFLALGGFRELASLEDYDLALRAVKTGARIQPAPRAVYRAHVRAGSRNSDQSVYAQLREEHAEVWT